MLNVDEVLSEALYHHQEGRLDQAENLYQQVLNEDALNSNALHLSGLLYYAKQQFTEAEERLYQAVLIQPNPKFIDSLGAVLESQGKWAEAASHYRKALFYMPNNETLQIQLGQALKEIGKLDEAQGWFEKVLALNPESTPALESLGCLYHAQGELEKAVACLTKSLSLEQYNPQGWFYLGNVLSDQRKFDKAGSVYEQALALSPNFTEAWVNLGLAHFEQNAFEEAVSYFQKALSINPDSIDAYNNLGNAYQRQGKYEEAIYCYNKVIEIVPDIVEAYTNLGCSHYELGSYETALTYFDKALEIDPHNVDAHWNQAHVWLKTGNFEKGWPAYEWRRQVKTVQFPNFSVPEWDGTPQPDATILVYAEGGFGDTFHFMRYLPQLKTSFKKVIFNCQPGTTTLLRDCPEYYDVLVEQGEPLPDFDTHIPLMTLAGILKADWDTLAVETPYLHVDETIDSAWRTYFKDFSGYKIGLVWASSSTNLGGKFRNCPLEAFKALGNHPNCQLFALQKGTGFQALELLKLDFSVVNLAAKLTDFQQTAAAVNNLDLIISVDTSVAHLAGALGKPVWILLPYTSEWRWFHNRTDSPWYPTAKLFRQQKFNDWAGVFQEVVAKLQQEIR